jgi:hypothetical protein
MDKSQIVQLAHPFATVMVGRLICEHILFTRRVLMGKWEQQGGTFRTSTAIQM